MAITFTVKSVIGLGNSSVLKLQTGVFTKAWRALR